MPRFHRLHELRDTSGRPDAHELATRILSVLADYSEGTSARCHLSPAKQAIIVGGIAKMLAENFSERASVDTRSREGDGAILEHRIT